MLPEGIPFPGTRSYSFFARSRIMQAFYKDVALDVAKEVSGGRILDVGTGPSYLPLRISEVLPGSEVIGIDVSEDMIRIARKNAEGKNVKFLVGDANKMPFEDDSFDLVVSTGSLHHWRNPVNVLNEIYRVLRPGRKALIYDLWGEAPKELLRGKLTELGYSFTAGLIAYGIVRMHSITSSELMKILREEGNFFKEYTIEEGWKSYPVVKVTLLKSLKTI
jgi:ubiquinone/menaquinone biosynthesis C-methylase UbiE